MILDRFTGLKVCSWTFYEDPPTPGANNEETPPPTNNDNVEDDKPIISQKKLNSVLAEDRRKHNKEKEQVIKQLEELKKSKGLSDREKETLQQKIEELQTSMLTKEQLAEKDKAKLLREKQETEQRLSKERDTWQRRFETATIERSIQDAAIQNHAFDPEQFVNLLAPNTRLVEVTDESGSGTGQFVPTVKFRDVDKEGKPVTLDLPVPEAIKRMTDMDRYANLFKSGATGGVGGKRETPSQRGDKGPPVGDAQAYRKWRQEQGLKGKTIKKG